MVHAVRALEQTGPLDDAQAMAEAQRGNQDGMGPGGPGEESAQRTDPLGRPLRSQDYGDDFSVKVPDEVDAQRARRVLEEMSPQHRLIEPQEVTSAALWLCATGSEGINGQALAIAGGEV